MGRPLGGKGQHLRALAWGGLRIGGIKVREGNGVKTPQGCSGGNPGSKAMSRQGGANFERMCQLRTGGGGQEESNQITLGRAHSLSVKKGSKMDIKGRVTGGRGAPQEKKNAIKGKHVRVRVTGKVIPAGWGGIKALSRGGAKTIYEGKKGGGGGERITRCHHGAVNWLSMGGGGGATGKKKAMGVHSGVEIRNFPARTLVRKKLIMGEQWVAGRGGPGQKHR